MTRRCAFVIALFAPRFCVLFLLACLFSTSALAQRGALNDPQYLNDVSPTYQTAAGTGVLVFTVYAERSSVHLDRQALLKLIDLTNQSELWQTTEGASQGVFT